MGIQWLTNGAAWASVVVFMAALGALIAMFYLSTPTTAGAVGVFMAFVLLYVVCLTALFLVIYIGSRILRKILPKKKTQEGSSRHIYYSASVLAFVPVLFLAMHSVGGIEVRDVLLLVIFIGIALFYVLKRTQ